MSFDILLQTAVLGLLQGGIYAIIAAGLTLVYGVMRIVNFAHGEFITLGMYLTLTAAGMGVEPYLAAPFIAAIVFLVAAAAFQLAIKPALAAPQINQMLVTIGISFILIGSAQLLWGANNQVTSVSWARSVMALGPVRITYPRAGAFVIAMAVAATAWWGLKHTKIGLAIRATAQEPTSARLAGIDVGRIQLFTFGAGAALAAVAGVLVAPIFPVNPTVGTDLFLLPAFVVVVLGTMGNFAGALVGGLILGTVESMGGFMIGSSFRQLISLSIFVAILLFMPRGLFGGRSS